MEPRQLSYELRKGESDDLTRRRWTIGLSMVGVGAAVAVTLYQTGIIRRLPDPPLPYIDSNKVDASTYAYKRLNSPDGPMMLINYGVTAWLAAAGGKERARENPLLPVALGVKTILDTALAPSSRAKSGRRTKPSALTAKPPPSRPSRPSRSSSPKRSRR